MRNIRKGMKAGRCLPGIWLLACMLLTAVSASAAVIDSSRTNCTLTISYEAVGAVCEIYRTADMQMDADGTLTFTLADAFADAKVSFEDDSTAGWSAVASTLAAYAVSQSVKPDAAVTIGEDGTAAVENLRTGLYLVTSAASTYNEYVYTVSPSLVTLPYTDDEKAVNTSKWSYDVTMEIKPDKAQETENPDVKQYKVIKQWSGDTSSSRPDEITVKITCKSGSTTSSQTVTLSADTDPEWTYSWETTDTEAVYSVDEDPVPTGYTRTVTKRTDSDGVTTFVITNTLKPTGSGGTTKKTTGSSGGTTKTSVKTGDYTDLAAPMVLLALSAATVLILGACLLCRRKGQR